MSRTQPWFGPRANHSRSSTPHEDLSASSSYASNKTVFGAILRNELPATILYEDERVLCFRDIRPVSKHHSLVIPKRQIAHSGALTRDDRDLVQHMENVACNAVKVDFPNLNVEECRQTNELSLGFHRWPCLSVHHLHLHTIYPMPCQHWWYRVIHPREYSWWYRPSTDFTETKTK
ncbi:adenosine 5'-monophosphoramidase HINT1 [Pycnococcus provasolii]